MAKSFRKKPLVVDAIQFDGSSKSKKACEDFCVKEKTETGQRGTFLVKTSKGKEFVKTGFWITKTEDGALSVYSKEKFEEIFEEVVEQSAE